MRRYIITGTPGAGKTTILAELAARGHAVVAEAATDVVARRLADGHDHHGPDPDFVDRIVALQRRRLDEPTAAATTVQFHDRSVLCTLALARYLGQPASDLLATEIDRVIRERLFQPQVFFVRPLGFVTPTAVRRISYELSLVFERFHEEVYREHGFELVEIARGPVVERVAAVEAHVRAAAPAPEAARAPDRPDEMRMPRVGGARDHRGDDSACAWRDGRAWPQGLGARP